MRFSKTWLGVGGLIAIPAVFYSLAMDRYFVSEDFGVLRLFYDNPWFKVIIDQFVSPCFGITYIKFYRPISTLILGLEFQLFGVCALPYLLFHLATHLMNTLIFFYCLKKLLSHNGAAWCAALLFSVYPLHPNAVLKISSYATLFSGTFVLLSFYFFIINKRRVLSLFCFVLALGAYEATAILPVLFLSYDLISPSSKRGRIATHGPYFVILILYMLLRKLIFDAFFGGYENLSQRMVSISQQMFADLMGSFYTLLYPSYGGGEWKPGLTAVSLCLVMFIVLCLMTRRLGRGPSLCLFALTWIILSQAPFAFTKVIPGNGRYWYITAMGLTLGIGAFLQIIRPYKRGLAMGVVVLALGALWTNLLLSNVKQHAQAGEITRKIQTQFLTQAQKAPPGTRFFLAGYPKFTTTPSNIPAAAVFAWGLSDVTRPPFTSTPVSLYPLPDFSNMMEAAPLLLADPSFKVFSWHGKSQSIVPFHGDPSLKQTWTRLEKIQVKAPADNATISRDGSNWRVVFKRGKYKDITLFVAAPGVAFKQRVDLSSKDQWITHPLPLKLEVAAYYQDKAYWWLAARDQENRVTALSPLRSFTAHQP